MFKDQEISVNIVRVCILALGMDAMDRIASILLPGSSFPVWWFLYRPLSWHSRQSIKTKITTSLFRNFIATYWGFDEKTWSHKYFQFRNLIAAYTFPFFFLNNFDLFKISVQRIRPTLTQINNKTKTCYMFTFTSLYSCMPSLILKREIKQFVNNVVLFHLSRTKIYPDKYESCVSICFNRIDAVISGEIPLYRRAHDNRSVQEFNPFPFSFLDSILSAQEPIRTLFKINYFSCT